MSVRRSPLLDGAVPGAGISRYDLYLALLPAPLLLGVVGALTTGMPVPYGAGIGSLCSALVLGQGLFRDAPTPADGRDGRSGRGGHERYDGRGAHADD